MSDIISYPGEENHLDLLFKNETFWLTQKQIAELFSVERTVVTKHLKKVFFSGEVDEKSNVQKMHIAGSDKPIMFYNLDIVLSVGYRVNTKKGTQFSQWETRVLHKKMKESWRKEENQKNMHLKELESLLQLVQSTLHQKELSHPEALGLLSIITEYTHSWLLFHQYDENQLPFPSQFSPAESIHLEYTEAKNAINELKENLKKKGEASDLFGLERSGSLEGIFGSVYQSAFTKEMYPSIAEKSAHLLYFIVKNHPFADGNKRIGAFLFLVFLAKNKCLENSSGEKKINDNGLVAITLLIAESDPKQKDILIKLVVNFLQED